MDELFSFINNSLSNEYQDKDSNLTYQYNKLIASLIVHYKFVYIHPFYGRNGRLSCILNHLIIFNQKDLIIVSVSHLIQYDKSNYCKAIRNSRTSYEVRDLTYFIDYMLEKINGYFMISKKIVQIKQFHMKKIKYLMRHKYRH